MLKKSEKKIKKRRIEEIAEEIEYMGQDSEDKAVPYVQEVGKRDQEAQQQEWDDSLNSLDIAKKSSSYSQILLEEAASFMLHFDTPKGFLWGVLKTSKGIVFWYKRPDGKTFAKGNTISLIPEYDMNGVVRKTYKMLDEMEAWEEQLEAQKKEIIIAKK